MGAESLVVYDGGGSRGGGYEFEKAGLYKIDKDGNVSAVGIFVKKNGKTKEERLDVHPYYINEIGDNYIYMFGGLRTSSEDWGPSMDMLINKKTGRIFDMTDLFGHNGGAQQNYTGKETSANTLLIWKNWGSGSDWNRLGRIAFSGDNAVYTALNWSESVTPYGFFSDNNGYVSELSNGTILSRGYGDVAMLFPNGGYDYLHDIANSKLNINVNDPWTSWTGLALNNGCSIIVKTLHNDGSGSGSYEWYNVTVGTQQGQYEVELTDTYTSEYFSHLDATTYIETSENVIVSNCGLSNLMLVYNKSTKKMSSFTPNFPDGTVMNLSPDCYFDGRAWDVRDKEAYWLNPSTFDSGVVDFNLDGIDVSSVEPSYSAGQVVVYGTRRSDASAVVATVDLATEKVEVLFTPRELTSIRLIPLN